MDSECISKFEIELPNYAKKPCNLGFVKKQMEQINEESDQISNIGLNDSVSKMLKNADNPNISMNLSSKLASDKETIL